MESNAPNPTRYLVRSEGRLAYDLAGPEGAPLVVCVPGMGDVRAEYRALAPRLIAAGYQVATMDVRGHGESSVGWADYSAAAIGADVVALVRELGRGPAVLLGTSMAAAAVAWAAAEAPELVRRVVVLGPFVRDVPTPWYLRLVFRLLLLPLWGRRAWAAYYRSLYKAAPPADLDAYVARLAANLAEPGRFEALRQMAFASKADCEARLGAVRAPALVVMGTRDPDFADPAAEARLVAGRLRGEVMLVDGAGHYPHVEQPAAVAERILAFVADGATTASGQAFAVAVAS